MHIFVGKHNLTTLSRKAPCFFVEIAVHTEKLIESCRSYSPTWDSPASQRSLTLNGIEVPPATSSVSGNKETGLGWKLPCWIGYWKENNGESDIVPPLPQSDKASNLCCAGAPYSTIHFLTRKKQTAWLLLGETNLKIRADPTFAVELSFTPTRITSIFCNSIDLGYTGQYLGNGK